MPLLVLTGLSVFDVGISYKESFWKKISNQKLLAPTKKTGIRLHLCLKLVAILPWAYQKPIIVLKSIPFGNFASSEHYTGVSTNTVPDLDKEFMSRFKFG